MPCVTALALARSHVIANSSRLHAVISPTVSRPVGFSVAREFDDDAVCHATSGSKAGSLHSTAISTDIMHAGGKVDPERLSIACLLSHHSQTFWPSSVIYEPSDGRL
jgi:hypothetical protein